MGEPFIITLSNAAKKDKRKLEKSCKDTRNAILETLDLLSLDPYDSRLKHHKIRSSGHYAVAVLGKRLRNDLRMVLEKNDNSIEIVRIGKHDIYKNL